MKFLTLIFFIISLLLLTTNFSLSIEKPKIGNVIIYENTVKHSDVVFKNINNEDINLIKFKNNLIILNFWATWCLPCRHEIPYLDQLQVNEKLSNIKILPINVGREGKEKPKIFFSELNVKNLEIFFDTSGNLANKFMLRGLPTTVFINKNGEEFARIVGWYDFSNEKFINWLKEYN